MSQVVGKFRTSGTIPLEVLLRPVRRVRRWFSRSEPQPNLLKLESAWQQQIAVQRHMVEVLRAEQPTLEKLQSALRHQVALHRHMIEVGRSVDQDILQKLEQVLPQKIDQVLRRELDLGLSEPSVLADVMGGLWNNLDQLHAQVQGIAELASINVASLKEHMAARFGAIEAQFAASLEERIASLDANIAARFGVIEAQFAAKIQSISAQAVGCEDLEALRARGEFIRRELMYEFRAALLEKGPPKTPPTTPKVVNATKVTEALGRGELRLNVGCGHISLADYVNVDRRELPGVDVIADVTDLPFEDAAVAEIHASHLLEHFPEEILRRVVLMHWRKKLRLGGVLRVVVPDAEAMISDFVNGEMSFGALREITFGGQD